MASAAARKETCQDVADTGVSEVCPSFYTSLDVLPSSEVPAAAVESTVVNPAASILTNQYYSARTQWMIENRNKFSSHVAFEIECSKVHHTFVHKGEDSGGDEDIDEEEDERELDEEILQANRETINKLKEHPLWWSRVRDINGDDRDGRFVVREKIGKGGEATIYAGVCRNLMLNRYVVAKVYRRGYYLRDLVKQWPEYNPSFDWNYWATYVEHVMLMPNDGRIAMVMKREWGDLRRLIDLMKETNLNQGPPFDLIKIVALMFNIAHSMKHMHHADVVHRDLKASNVLLRPSQNHRTAWENNVAASEPPLLHADSSLVKVSDYECALGVMGTGFWRAPEVLLGIRDPINWRSPTSLFTKESDVYSYGMVCYEIATGFLPFEREGFDGTRAEQDRVISGERPTFPDDVDRRVKALILRCWQQDERARPTFQEIHLELWSLKREIKECS